MPRKSSSNPDMAIQSINIACRYRSTAIPTERPTTLRHVHRPGLAFVICAFHIRTGHPIQQGIEFGFVALRRMLFSKPAQQTLSPRFFQTKKSRGYSISLTSNKWLGALTETPCP